MALNTFIIHKIKELMETSESILGQINELQKMSYGFQKGLEFQKK